MTNAGKPASGRDAPTRANATTLLGALSGLFGLLLAALGILILVLVKESAAGFLLTLVIYVGIGLISLRAGYSLLRGKAWGGWSAFATGICCLLLGVLLVLTLDTLDVSLGILGLVVGFWMLVDLRSRGARAGGIRNG